MTGRHRACRIEELPGGIHPFAALGRFGDPSQAALLDSGGPPSPNARYAYLCVDPMLEFHSKRERCFAGPPGDAQPLGGPPFEELRTLLQGFRGQAPPIAAGLPPFLGGAVGYLGYELLYLIEQVSDLGRDDLQLPDCALVFYRTVIAADRVEGRAWAICNGFGDSDSAAGREADHGLRSALARLAGLERETGWEVRHEALRNARRLRQESRPRLTEEVLEQERIRPVMDRARYLGVVEHARERILAGDVFEVCTSNRFDTAHAGPGVELYRALRAANEAPFGAYLRFPGMEVLCASPERFVRLDREGWAETRPIKGTRPRGRTPEEDVALREELATSEKDRAENIMIVDLARNDLGRVCALGTVTVPELRIIESFPFTHQMVSTVRGRLRGGLEAIDLVRAAFPGGSITGAPKVEAMKLIDRLEPVKRGVFSGSIGFFDFDGGMDLNIAIRTFVRKGEHLTFHVGGAVVADSDPAAEYQETLDKAHGLVAALELARRGA